MSRSVKVPLRAAVATAVAAGAVAAVPFLTQPAGAVQTVPLGYAAANGGTTGGSGGATVTATTGTAIHQALCSRPSASTPIVIQVSGTISLANTTKVSSSTRSCDTASDAIELKGVSNVTLIGSGTAVFDGIGIHLREARNIVIRNVSVRNVKKSNGPTSNGGDAIGMESGVSNVWIDHNSLSASGGEDQGFDGLLDMKAGVTYVTVSYTTFRNSGRGGLIGSSDTDKGNGPVTFHHNWYENVDSRTPLLRAATAHLFDNYYSHLNSSGINPRNGGRARVENNYFKDSQNVLGTFYTDLPGYWEAKGNVLDNVTWTPKDAETNPAGPSMTSNASVSVPYAYTLDPAACVPAIVQATAGAGTNLATSAGCGQTTPPTTSSAPTTTTTKTTKTKTTKSRTKTRKTKTRTRTRTPKPTTTTSTTAPTTTPPSNGAIYAAPGGSAGAAGTQSAPTTLAAALTRVAPGGTVYVRGGVYSLSTPLVIATGNDGTAAAPKTLAAYPGEQPVLDFSAMSEDPANRGLTVNGDYWHVLGLTVQRAGDNGIFVGGSHNVIERVVTAFNRDSGLQISRADSTTPSSDWPSYNLVVSSESHDNADSDGEDADGFAAKLTAGPGNVFRYTVSHHNIDDGWDLFAKPETGPIGVVTIEDSLSYANGTLSNGTVNTNGDRNGYKLGGSDIKVDHVVRRSIAYKNGHHGFTYNSNPGSMSISGNLSIDNGERNYSFDAGTSTFTNNASCRFSGGGSTDKTVGNVGSTNQFWSGSNGSRCGAYSGALAWSFASDGKLVVTLGGRLVSLS
ncbi:MAG: right-handed parallel beta-helix repeat-containing protein [Kineosporiaceae bacterium]